ncbi:Phosphate transport system protein PhoU [Acididesulfobacillus acetoxydans]|uniref:Phosphate-specific transport system accessory protein PhoU n=1 Tax=Acididesulfobacillus acetoxydans TaxID=1561005 RepID=A0A8S0WM61_9FIRM|nr:phosphate signaling complex protein PhoU [Acididesulfobacillus acetoxydans]CAA7600404.1 Phosphate transport system protein PhoU [Acididesulfobacillus acetoxydans]CEJ06538.1 Phosphate-specific transport system accessory protein PhoU [Acididesulfobacillus acetoxydans]
MRQPLTEGLVSLISLLRQMEQEVDRMLQDAIRSLKDLDREGAEQCILADPKVNGLETQVNEACVRLIVTQQPVASDIRKIVSAMKISTDLERMADLAVDVAKVVKRIEGPLMKPLIDIPRMADLTVRMIHRGLEAYEKEDAALAAELAVMDDEVDHLYNAVIKDLITLMAADLSMTTQGMYLSFVARYIERIADHATNIGEHVIYIVSGERKDLN